MTKNHPRKLLFFHHSDAVGGAGLSGLNFIKSLDKNEYDITVYCYSGTGKMPELFRKEVKVIEAGRSPVYFSHFSGGYYPFFSIHTLKNFWLIHKDKDKIRQVIDNIDPEIVVVNSMTLFWIGKIAKKRNCETICLFRETYTRGMLGFRTWVIKHYLSKFFDKVSFISQFDMMKNAHLKCHTQVLYNALDYSKISTVDTKSCETYGLDPAKFKILYVGGMASLKGAKVLIQALNYLREENVECIFLGYEWNGERKKLSDCKGITAKLRYLLDCDYEKKCISLLIKNRLAPIIKFFPVSTAVMQMYEVCDALVFPSAKPHQARPVFEAGFAKIPVIISDYPNTREFIDSTTGYLFKSGDAKDLADKILYAKSDPCRNDKIEKNFYNSCERHSFIEYKKNVGEFMKEK